VGNSNTKGGSLIISQLRRLRKQNRLIAGLTGFARRSRGVDEEAIAAARTFATLRSNPDNENNYAKRYAEGSLTLTDYHTKFMLLSLIFNASDKNEIIVHEIIDEVLQGNGRESLINIIAMINSELKTDEKANAADAVIDTEEMDKIGIYKFFKKSFFQGINAQDHRVARHFGMILTQLPLVDNIDNDDIEIALPTVLVCMIIY
jgi:hypothetical protein